MSEEKEDVCVCEHCKKGFYQKDALERYDLLGPGDPEGKLFCPHCKEETDLIIDNDAEVYKGYISYNENKIIDKIVKNENSISVFFKKADEELLISNTILEELLETSETYTNTDPEHQNVVTIHENIKEYILKEEMKKHNKNNS